MLAKLVRRLLDVLPRIVTVVLERPEEKEPADPLEPFQPRGAPLEEGRRRPGGTVGGNPTPPPFCGAPGPEMGAPE